MVDVLNVIVWLELNSLQGGTKCDVAIFCGKFWCNFLQQKPAQKFCLITLITMMCLSSILVLNAPVAPDLKLLTSIVQIKDFPFIYSKTNKSESLYNATYQIMKDAIIEKHYITLHLTWDLRRCIVDCWSGRWHIINSPGWGRMA